MTEPRNLSSARTNVLRQARTAVRIKAPKARLPVTDAEKVFRRMSDTREITVRREMRKPQKLKVLPDIIDELSEELESASDGEIPARRKLPSLSDTPSEELEEEPVNPKLPSSWILWALGIIMTLQELAGLSVPFGLSAVPFMPLQPERGDGFKDGSTRFTDVNTELAQAVVDPQQWSGKAADSYNEANATLMTQARTLADLDGRMAAIVEDQADWVAKTQLGLGVEQDALLVAYPIIRALETRPDAFVGACIATLAIVSSAYTAATGLVANLIARSVINAGRANTTSGQYGEVSAAAQHVASDGAPARVSVADTAGSGAVGFGAVSASMSGSPLSSGAPTPLPPHDPAAVPAAATRRSAAAPVAASAAPAGASSTLGQIDDAGGIAMQVEPGFAQAATQGMQSVQQVAGMAAQTGRRAKAPAAQAADRPAADAPGQDAATHTAGEEDPVAGATSASVQAGRAPVDAAASAAAPAPAAGRPEHGE